MGRLNNAYRAWRAGREPKGASTITMQVAKNFFLWPGRSVIRKGFEAYLTVLLEFFWDKHRIMEVYLNVIEWGEEFTAPMRRRIAISISSVGADGAGSGAARAVLPDPRDWSPVRPTQYIAERAANIRDDMPAMAVPSANGCRYRTLEQRKSGSRPSATRPKIAAVQIPAHADMAVGGMDVAQRALQRMPFDGSRRRPRRRRRCRRRGPRSCAA